MCVAAIDVARHGLDLDSFTFPLPATASFSPGGDRTQTWVSVREIIRQHSLSRFVLDDDGVRKAIAREWDVNDALAAWELADEGKWEIPSPIPSWPEFVSLLLVGRNFTEPGEEDDPGERDQIRSWWGPDGWRRSYNVGWWDVDTVQLMSLPEPAPEPEVPWSATEWADGFLVIAEWLRSITAGTRKESQAFLPRDWAKLIDPIWRPDDLGWTEALIRRSMGQELFPGKHPTGVADLNALLARVLLEQGRDEEALAALKPLDVWKPVTANLPYWWLMRLPYWWLQIRCLAEGRLAKDAGDTVTALRSFMTVVRIPHSGRYADPDYVLQGLYELAMLDATGLDGARARKEWARLALAVADGFQQRHETTGWSLPKGYSVETKEQLHAVIDSPTVWKGVHEDRYPIEVNRSDWSDELGYLHEFLEELASNLAVSLLRPFLEEIGQLWNPRDPEMTRSAVSSLLIDAHYRRWARDTDRAKESGPPWHGDYASAIPQLEALLVRVLAGQGDWEGARAALVRAFGSVQKAKGWVLQLEALTIGRLAIAAGDKEAAFDFFWLAVRRWYSESFSDNDLLLETIRELALLGYISPLHPYPSDWARLAAMIADNRPDDEYHPSPWNDREFRAPLDWIGEAASMSAPDRRGRVRRTLPDLADELQAAGRTDLATQVRFLHTRQPMYEIVDMVLDESLSVGRALGLATAHEAWAFWDRPRQTKSPNG